MGPRESNFGTVVGLHETVTWMVHETVAWKVHETVTRKGRWRGGERERLVGNHGLINPQPHRSSKQCKAHAYTKKNRQRARTRSPNMAYTGIKGKLTWES
ncbi:hypothetical protein E2C01_057933 [Portunus trituberculatus]|uniref:Uncharacterized protein n=1 Tax=Portunus trituberculatus TaxID=210409 RepID=A0A5B7H1U6_PORTR|nr:hypothetical protein [Portunus trituberculatus]